MQEFFQDWSLLRCFLLEHLSTRVTSHPWTPALATLDTLCLSCARPWQVVMSMRLDKGFSDRFLHKMTLRPRPEPREETATWVMGDNVSGENV